MDLRIKLRNAIESFFNVTILNGRLERGIWNEPGPSLNNDIISDCRLLPSRYDVLKLLPKGGTAVEVGVAYGDFTECIVNDLTPDKFYGLDLFTIKPGHEPWGETRLRDSGLSHLDFYRRRIREYQCDAEAVVGTSWEELSKFPDEYFDYVYLDADHAYTSVKADLSQISSKLKKGGHLQVNDYTHFNSSGLVPYGVKQAVNEMVAAGGYRMVYYCLDKNDLFDVVFEKTGR